MPRAETIAPSCSRPAGGQRAGVMGDGASHALEARPSVAGKGGEADVSALRQLRSVSDDRRDRRRLRRGALNGSAATLALCGAICLSAMLAISLAGKVPINLRVSGGTSGAAIRRSGVACAVAGITCTASASSSTSRASSSWRLPPSTPKRRNCYSARGSPGSSPNCCAMRAPMTSLISCSVGSGRKKPVSSRTKPSPSSITTLSPCADCPRI
jgi:hypothetical protein